MPSFARRGDFWSGLVLAALGAYVVTQAHGWDYMTEDGPGPGFFPTWYGSAMVVLSLWLVGTTALKPGADGARATRSELTRAIGTWLAFVLCVVLMPYAGFLIGFALLTWFIVHFMAGQSHRRGIALGIGGSALFYVTFELALGVGLPHGLLF
jgi:putative tricarboxylic transport membrane protein